MVRKAGKNAKITPMLTCLERSRLSLDLFSSDRFRLERFRLERYRPTLAPILRFRFGQDQSAERHRREKTNS